MSSFMSQGVKTCALCHTTIEAGQVTSALGEWFHIRCYQEADVIEDAQMAAVLRQAALDNRILAESPPDGMPVVLMRGAGDIEPPEGPYGINPHDRTNKPPNPPASSGVRP
jgi:hypothetical protein